MRERELIEWICRRWRPAPRRVPVGPGDDCAVVAVGGQKVLMTIDQVLDGVHFVLERDGPAAAGRKAMARSLSDVAAMAGAPLAAVASVALPAGAPLSLAKAVCRGMADLGERFSCPLVGGDVGAWAGPLAITVTVLGRPGPSGAILRSGARAGDAICVTGRLGGAWRTRRHLSFTPRLAEARALARRCDLHAMIDISDGLAIDLDRLCRASGLGADLRSADIPIHRGATLEQALGDGEDYELLLALPARQVPRLGRLRLGVPLTAIGTVRAGHGMILIDARGRRRRLAPAGWEHRT